MTSARLPLAKDLGALGVFVVAAALVGWLGSLATSTSLQTWYASLVKPDWTPSGATIGTVWAILYGLMAVAAWLVWRSGSERRNVVPLVLWGCQLILNLAWSYIFFVLRSPGGGFIELVVLWVFVGATIAAFYFAHKVASVLLLPYLAWLTFAGVLNFAIWRMNG